MGNVRAMRVNRSLHNASGSGIYSVQVMTCTYADTLAGSTLFFKCEIFQKR